MSERPRIGEALHFVEHAGLRCSLVVLRGFTHPSAGDDGEWCISIDYNGWGHRDHVPHGFEAGHWHRREEHPHGGPTPRQ